MAGVDADADEQLGAGDVHRAHDLEARRDGAVGVVGVALRRAEDREQAVAHELVDVAAVPRHRGDDHLEEAR